MAATLTTTYIGQSYNLGQSYNQYVVPYFTGTVMYDQLLSLDAYYKYLGINAPLDLADWTYQKAFDEIEILKALYVLNERIPPEDYLTLLNERDYGEVYH
jgi:hypothetical protein